MNANIYNLHTYSKRGKCNILVFLALVGYTECTHVP